MHRGPAAYVLGPPPSRSRDLELEGGVIACHVDYVYEPQDDGHHLYERGVDLEVEGVRYIEMHRGPAAYVLGPPPSRSRDLELEGGVIACHVDHVYEPQDSHVRGTE